MSETHRGCYHQPMSTVARAHRSSVAFAMAILWASGCMGPSHSEAKSSIGEERRRYVDDQRAPDLASSLRAVRCALDRGGEDWKAARDLFDACRTPEDWREVVEGLDIIHMRSKWIADEPMHVWIRGCDWTGSPWRITVVPTDARLDVVTAQEPGGGEWGGTPGPWVHTLGLARSDMTSVDFDVSIYLSGATSTHAAELRWFGRIRKPITVVESLDVAIPILRSPTLDGVVRESISLVRTDREVGIPFEIQVNLPNPGDSNGVSLRIELWRGDTYMQSIDVPCHGVGPRLFGGGWGAGGLSGVPPEMTIERASSERWTLHVTGTNEGLLDSWAVERAWGGEFTMPLSEAMGNAW